MEEYNAIGKELRIEEITKKSRNLNPNELLYLLKNSMGLDVFLSWGASSFVVDNKANCRMFRMSVNGHHHKGYVYIFLNAGDLFDFYLVNKDNIIVDIVKDVYFDDLTELIDSKIERIDAYKH